MSNDLTYTKQAKNEVGKHFLFKTKFTDLTLQLSKTAFENQNSFA